MAKKTANLLVGLSNAKTRTFVILFGAIILIGVVIAIIRGQQKPTDVLSKQGSQAVSVPSEIKSTPGNIVSEQYRELQVAENERRAQEALQKKTSAIPTIIGAIADTDGKNKGALNNNLQGPGQSGFQSGEGFEDIGKSLRQREREQQEARIKEQREHLEKIRADKERDLRLQRERALAAQQKKEYEASVQKIQSQMKNYAQGAYTEWSKYRPQAYVQGPLAGKAFVSADTNMGSSENGNHYPQASSARNAAINKRKIYIKAGSVLFGVLDTAINSDEPGPILATIVSGKYRGGKLIGSLQHSAQQETVVITFVQMSLPKRPKSFGVKAVAIDPDTARTALASDVDHHYLLRYGSLFASAFVSGYGKALTQQGSTTTVSPLTGTTTTSYPPLNNREIFLAALGEVGTQWGQVARMNFSTPYTVTVNQGTGVGLLFLSDVDATEEDVANGQ